MKFVRIKIFIVKNLLNLFFLYLCIENYAGIAQLEEHNLAKVRVAGSSPVSRSNVPEKGFFVLNHVASVVELVDTQDLKSCGPQKAVPVRFRFEALKKTA